MGLQKSRTWLSDSAYIQVRLEQSYLFILFFGHITRILVPQLCLEPILPVVEAQSPNLWNTGDFPYESCILKSNEKYEVNNSFKIQKMKIMASGPITSWQIDGETMETVTDFIFLGSKITADGDCSHEIKRYMLLGRKAMPNLDSILKSRDITLPTMVHLVIAMVFPVVMYGYGSWTIKKAEWRKLMLLNCGGEDSWESLGLQGDPTSPS